MRTRPRSRAALAVAIALFGPFPGIAFGDEGPEEPPIPRTKIFEHYLAVVDAQLPAFSSSILTVPDGPDWMAGKSVHQVALAVQDSDPGTMVGSGPILMGYDPPDGPRYVKLDFDEGYIRYINRDRSFHLNSPCAAVPMTEAAGALLATVSALGLPSQEWDIQSVNTVVERTVDGEGQDPPTEQTCEVEQMATLTRQATNGLPIFNSMARESVSNVHERARLLIDWPRFVLQTGLIMRTRTAVVEDLAERIWTVVTDSTGLGAEIDLQIDIGYDRTVEGFLPVAKASFFDIFGRYAGMVLDVPLAYNPTSGVGSEVAATAVQFRAHVDALGGNVLLEFELQQSENVRLEIFDVSGRAVIVLADAEYSPGWHQLEWNMRDDSNRLAPAGIYFARLRAGSAGPTRRILVVR